MPPAVSTQDLRCSPRRTSLSCRPANVYKTWENRLDIVTPERWRQIENLFQSVLRLAPNDREALLQNADPELRRDVESLLEHQLPVDEKQAPSQGHLAPGTSVGPYRIEALLGEGGAGIVYRAHDSRLNRTVAIKLLSPRAVDATARQRFQREARMASGLNHPHILTVYDVGEWEGREYIVTEYVDGGTLRNWSRQQARSPEEVAGLLTGVAEGLGMLVALLKIPDPPRR